MNGQEVVQEGWGWKRKWFKKAGVRTGSGSRRLGLEQQPPISIGLNTQKFHIGLQSHIWSRFYLFICWSSFPLSSPLLLSFNGGVCRSLEVLPEGAAWATHDLSPLWWMDSSLKVNHINPASLESCYSVHVCVCVCVCVCMCVVVCVCVCVCVHVFVYVCGCLCVCVCMCVVVCVCSCM